MDKKHKLSLNKTHFVTNSSSGLQSTVQIPFRGTLALYALGAYIYKSWRSARFTFVSRTLKILRCIQDELSNGSSLCGNWEFGSGEVSLETAFRFKIDLTIFKKLWSPKFQNRKSVRVEHTWVNQFWFT